MVHITGYGIAVSFGVGAPATLLNRTASSRMVIGGFVGTCQARPQARSSTATVTRVLATPVIDVQLCGTPRGAGAYARLPASTGLPIRLAAPDGTVPAPRA